MLSYPLTLLGGIGVSCAYLLPWWVSDVLLWLANNSGLQF
jgi:hypothetical protein